MVDDKGDDKNNNSSKKQVDPVAKEHWRKGNSLFEAKDYDNAIIEFTEAINIEKEYADAYFNRALTYRMKEDYSSAKKDLDKVIELEPKSSDAPLLMGDIAEANNDLVSARFWYEKALTNHPDYTEAKNRIERIDMMMHIDSTYSKNEKTKQLEIEKYDYTETKIEEGQIKQVAFYRSKQTLDSVIGLEKLKKYLRENIVLSIKEPALFKKYGKDIGLGTILYGPPGVGKTYTVNGIAGEAEANVILAVPNQIVDMYTGNTEKNLHMIFETARKHKPCIIFFDELDALGIKRGGGNEGGESSAMRLAVNQFLMEMSSAEQAKNDGVYVIGATNTPWDIDPALKRSGRFGDHIYLPPPSYWDRKKLFDFYTKNKPRGHINFDRLARATMGYSPADIKKITDKAVMKPLLHEYFSHKERKLTTHDIISVLKDKDFGGSSLDEWYNMVKKDIISKVETQIIDGKKQEIVKEGKLDAEEKVEYKKMIRDIKNNTSPLIFFIKRLMRWWALNIF